MTALLALLAMEMGIYDDEKQNKDCHPGENHKGGPVLPGLPQNLEQVLEHCTVKLHLGGHN